ncbi:hypothetical protein FIBSPDRAFT_905399 [Athelia psychrophila]|uniref:Uncharacterized protein n=1 Tax=Athelia psychrophila TaxID=1759441 RepID=A0A167THA7_9AGAM|nr:hypothetical protein FIBSPDRAFT_905399 [Fibularhizoctonia sp. CBS 109695]
MIQRQSLVVFIEEQAMDSTRSKRQGKSHSRSRRFEVSVSIRREPDLLYVFPVFIIVSNPQVESKGCPHGRPIQRTGNLGPQPTVASLGIQYTTLRAPRGLNKHVWSSIAIPPGTVPTPIDCGKQVPAGYIRRKALESRMNFAYSETQLPTPSDYLLWPRRSDSQTQRTQELVWYALRRAYVEEEEALGVGLQHLQTALPQQFSSHNFAGMHVWNDKSWHSSASLSLDPAYNARTEHHPVDGLPSYIRCLSLYTAAGTK